MHNLSFKFYISLTDLTPIFTIGQTVQHSHLHTKHTQNTFKCCIWLKIYFSHVPIAKNILQLLWLFCGRSDKFIRKFLHMAWFMHLIHSYFPCLYGSYKIQRKLKFASAKWANEWNKQAKTHCSNDHKMSVCNTHSKLSILTACNERAFNCICK